MKKTELVQFKEEYESAVRNVDEIINNPYTAILLKYKKAEESNYCIKFRQYALRYWGQLHGVDFSEFGDAKQLIKLYRKHVDYELNNESSLRGYKDLYDCFMTDPKIECNEPEDELIYAPLKNGVFELVEWKLHPHSPDQVTFTYIKAKYAPKAECPIFEGYLHRVTGGDPQLMERFWMVIGYLLIYPARGKFFIFMKGVGNSGKSVLGSFIRSLYPKESISSIRLKNLTNQFGMASLATSVINFDMDMPSSRINDEAASRLKQITGGDSMNIPRKYRDDALLERRMLKLRKQYIGSLKIN